MQHVRDYAVTAAIFGFFASAWFGWAQERPPLSWRRPLMLAAVTSIVVAAIGGVLAWRYWDGGSALNEPGAMRAYGITVGVEFALAGLGAAVLGVRKRADLIPPWICLVVGAHFAPLAPILNNPWLYALAAVMTVVALVAVPIARRRDLLPSAVTGVGAGAALLTFAVASAIVAL
jgi:hypothetical protein